MSKSNQNAIVIFHSKMSHLLHLHSQIHTIKQYNYTHPSMSPQELQLQHDDLLSLSLATIDTFTQVLMDNQRENEMSAEEHERDIVGMKQEIQDLKECLDDERAKYQEIMTAMMSKDDENERLASEVEMAREHISKIEISVAKEQKSRAEETERYLHQIESLKEVCTVVSREKEEAEEKLNQILRFLEEEGIIAQRDDQNGLEDQVCTASPLNQSLTHSHSSSVNQCHPIELNELKFQSSNERCDRVPQKLTQRCNLNLSSNKENRQSFNSLQRYQERLSMESCEKPMKLQEILRTSERCGGVHLIGNFYSREREEFLYGIDGQSNEKSEREEKGKICEPQEKTFRVIEEFTTGESERDMNSNPYYTFFLLTCQCAKINSGNLEAASTVDLSSHWDLLLSRKIPIHLWYKEILGSLPRNEKRRSKKRKSSFVAS